MLKNGNGETENQVKKPAAYVRRVFQDGKSILEKRRSPSRCGNFLFTAATLSMNVFSLIELPRWATPRSAGRCREGGGQNLQFSPSPRAVIRVLAIPAQPPACAASPFLIIRHLDRRTVPLRWRGGVRRARQQGGNPGPRRHPSPRDRGPDNRQHCDSLSFSRHRLYFTIVNARFCYD
jgi:hypothetical protein